MAESPDINAKNERKMSKSQFYHFLPEIAEKLYPGHKEKVELMFKNLLTERPMLNLKEAIQPPKVLSHDEVNRRLLCEPIIEVLNDF
eukprot:CAMPEP_0114581964 /NCGR_PEP_ID=MMETSP0125-20121206/6012_1 /TAXON_ID=485358 ORGANISM="Aristerostoma sp., Strain ATCC 50986" /NCGR_SAMPLE_ID=MMETSP0125 /ASSEMBLY_ACC=CAM_ASM_000245 /LENGTH=86 /DNA_ID=CAMNT_0001774577 /DNA_START=194 /DNA_END=454 /DNA_ORIENTATION=+